VKTDSVNTIDGFPAKLVSDKWLEEYKNTGKGQLRILSNSMAPLIKTGDQIFIEKVESSKIHVGDIITFWKNSVLVTHRVLRKVRKEGDVFYIERGDRYSQHSLVTPQSLVESLYCCKF